MHPVPCCTEPPYPSTSSAAGEAFPAYSQLRPSVRTPISVAASLDACRVDAWGYSFGCKHFDLR